MPSNKILPLAAGLVLLMAIFIGLKSCNDPSNQPATLKEIPKLGTAPDTDSPADTIRSLTAEVDSLTQESKQLSGQNVMLLKQKKDIERQIESKMLKKLEEHLPDTQRMNSMMGDLSSQVDFFKNRLEEISQSQQQPVENDIPVGFGLDDTAGDQVIWVEPLGTPVDAQGHAILPTTVSGSLLNPDKKTSDDSTSLDFEPSVDQVKDALDTEKPVYTVPRNSTLIGSTSMTALIGRIPFQGVVQEPFPFKVIVGKDNLAANGIDMPQLDGMIFSGKSSGDWTLSCVRGSVHSVTYLFSDGTIRTLSSDEQGANNGGSKSKLTQNDRPLGWISDRRGIPCISGKRISNASDYLAGQVVASAASAAAAALSQNETTNTVSSLTGAATSIITGDRAKHAGYNAVSGGVDEVAQYMRERAAQSFDVVYVDTGVELAVHVDVELAIDYETKGRKTSYANQTDFYSDFLD